jgi:hypothetical protein
MRLDNGLDIASVHHLLKCTHQCPLLVQADRPSSLRGKCLRGDEARVSDPRWNVMDRDDPVEDHNDDKNKAIREQSKSGRDRPSFIPVH